MTNVEIRNAERVAANEEEIHPPASREFFGATYPIQWAWPPHSRWWALFFYETAAGSLNAAIKDKDRIGPISLIEVSKLTAGQGIPNV